MSFDSQDALYLFVRYVDPVRTTLVVWLFMTGGVIGSFLNVVVYRLPLGMALAHPPSRCPECLAPIRGRDNIPMLGWLRLRGRCHNCRAAISPRYPLVELAVAMLFALLALAGPMTGGANLPNHDPFAAPGMRFGIFGEVEPWGAYAYHITLGTTLLAVALLAIDGFDTPRRLALFALCVGLLAPLADDSLRPVHSGLEVWLPDMSGGWRLAVLDGAAGVLAGGMLGWLAPRTRPRLRSAVRAWPSHRVAGVIVGAFLGWQAVAALAAVAASLFVPLSWLGSATRAKGAESPWAAVLAALVPVWIALWSRVAAEMPGFANDGDAVVLALSAACVAAASYWTWTPSPTPLD